MFTAQTGVDLCYSCIPVRRLFSLFRHFNKCIENVALWLLRSYMFNSSFWYKTTKILKDAFYCLPCVMTNLFNHSLSSCKFPLKWKRATIIPYHKGGPKADVNNYRPISLLPLPGKLLERITHTRLLKYLEGIFLVTPNQHGFRPERSTIDVVTNFTDDIFNAINEGKCTLTLFISPQPEVFGGL